MSGAFLKWAGSKKWFVDQLGTSLPTEFNRYIEPFLGSGSVFFYLQPKNALLCDVNQELIDTYLSVKNDVRSVIYDLQDHVDNHSENYYYMLRSHTEEPGSSEAAARMIYLNKACFNGIYRVNADGIFNVPFGKKKKITIDYNGLLASSAALQNAKISCQDFAKTIGQARKGDFLFCDPPYAIKGTNESFVGYTQNCFDWNSQVKLADSLLKAKKRGVKVLMTNAAHESIISLYPKDEFQSVIMNRKCMIAGAGEKSKSFNELIVWGNFDFNVE